MTTERETRRRKQNSDGNEAPAIYLGFVKESSGTLGAGGPAFFWALI